MNYHNLYNFQPVFQNMTKKDESTTKYRDTGKVSQEWELEMVRSAIYFFSFNSKYIVFSHFIALSLLGDRLNN